MDRIQQVMAVNNPYWLKTEKETEFYCSLCKKIISNAKQVLLHIVNRKHNSKAATSLECDNIMKDAFIIKTLVYHKAFTTHLQELTLETRILFKCPWCEITVITINTVKKLVDHLKSDHHTDDEVIKQSLGNLFATMLERITKTANTERKPKRIENEFVKIISKKLETINCVNSVNIQKSYLNQNFYSNIENIQKTNQSQNSSVTKTDNVPEVSHLNILMIGTSHIRRWPVDLFPQNFHIIKLPTPTSILKISQISNTLIPPTFKSPAEFSIALISAGGFDIGLHELREIYSAIINTAKNLSKLNFLPLVLPIINRKYSRHCDLKEYNAFRQQINKWVRDYVINMPYKVVVNIPQYLDHIEDQVHLTNDSYKIITNQIMLHLQESFPKLNILPNPPPNKYVRSKLLSSLADNACESQQPSRTSNNSDNKPVGSRRENLLKQLRALEDNIQRKRKKTAKLHKLDK